MKKKAKSSIWTLFFPPKCVVCGTVINRRAKNQAICAVCYDHLLGELSSGCPVCHKSFAECACYPLSISADGFAFGLPYDRARGAARKLILCCKSHHQRNVLDILAGLMIEAGKKEHFFEEMPLMAFIPRAPEKIMKTGIDPAKGLAEAIAAKLGLQCVALISRKPGGREQKKLNEAERRINVSHLYCPTEQMIRASDRCVVLVDDIVTTGATLDTCVGIIRAGGAKRVYCLTAGKTLLRRYDQEI